MFSPQSPGWAPPGLQQVSMSHSDHHEIMLSYDSSSQVYSVQPYGVGWVFCQSSTAGQGQNSLPMLSCCVTITDQGWVRGSCLIVAPAYLRVWEDPCLFSSNEISDFKVFGFFPGFCCCCCCCCLFCLLRFVLSPIQNSIFKHYFITKHPEYNF